MKKELVITARVHCLTTVEGETIEEIEEKAQNILENISFEEFDWDEGEYEIMNKEDVPREFRKRTIYEVE